MSWSAKMIALADIFEALTTGDRPTRRPRSYRRALKSFGLLKKDKHVGADLFNLFLSFGTHKDYAEQFLRPEKIDEVDISKYLEQPSQAAE